MFGFGSIFVEEISIIEIFMSIRAFRCTNNLDEGSVPEMCI